MKQIKRPLNIIGLWRTKALARNVGAESFPIDLVFPSGRQALSSSLAHVGLSRQHRVAIPEWSSQCVINAVGRYAAPIPMAEVLRYHIPISAVLVYEQWGWPFVDAAMETIKERFKGIVFIRDMVDSAHFMLDKEGVSGAFSAYVRILSLSKLLGFSGGGLAVVDDKYLPFKPDIGPEMILKEITKNDFQDEDLRDLHSVILKSSVKACAPQLLDWLAGNDLMGAIEDERIARQHNLRQVAADQLSLAWPGWMKAAIQNGAGPGIVPLLRGSSNAVMLSNREKLLSKHGVDTCIYHFNWSGNPLEPQYEPCLAIPVHGQVNNINDILREIKV